MPVPLPAPDDVHFGPPTEDEALAMARGVATAAALGGHLSHLQRALLKALFHSLTKHDVDLRTFDPMSATELAGHVASRDLIFRSRLVQIMLLAALVLRPLPEEVVDQITEYARELEVEEGMITVAQEFASGSLGLAGVDFQRNGYTADWDPHHAEMLHTSAELSDAWDSAITDPALTARWQALENLPEGTLGRMVTEMYRARGFEYPGTPGSAPPLLAQHDWVHIVADFGTTVESEIEVFGFIAEANDNMHAFSLLAMVISLFETGYLRAGAGLFQASEGHISHDPRVLVRLADAMYRGGRTHDARSGSESVDFLRVDWFELADRPIEEVRQMFGVEPKSSEAREAASMNAWEPGGISPYQLASGQAMAARLGVPYDSFGASIEPPP
ncbi:MAG: hypothetical protein QOF81_2962 [Acidimicrobiaceae bacterium]|nr:hypothetical protein [Acidimicrobiaceae bacterium]MDQ1401296.1 hypothetical protein [Acidimicrobiaceae bacterium]MDQ1417349.1 hypothetical protein [Acidimicrobiaceae bacterium]MDQ1442889.1 hypothetical protein [Acidimicrobiaceae bacterium]